MIVEVQQGKLKGIESTSVLSGFKYCSFLGIPYAKPPVGNLRFQPPEPADKWDGIRDASVEGKGCTQEDLIMKRNIEGSEDCLYLNVYTPGNPEQINNKAVMVFIHGGGFASGSGSSDFYSPDYLIEHDVILVTINYRLHVFGFLNLELPDCNGNAGLKDQRLALIWIKENIKSFGGDPENITLFGESAGASSVHFHMICPASKGLFNKAILQSGSSLCPWSFTDEHLEDAFKLGEVLGFTGKTSEELLSFLKTQDDLDIVNANSKLMAKIKETKPCYSTGVIFVPSLEKFDNQGFITELPTELMKKAIPIPLIVGRTNKEGILAFRSCSENLMKQMNEDFSLVVKNNLKGIEESKISEVANAIKEFYFGKKIIGFETLDEYTDMYTDIYFKEFYESFDFVTKSEQQVFVYEFAYDGGLNLFKQLLTLQFPVNIKGASHADELAYMFHVKMVQAVPTDPKDLSVTSNLCSLWSNFAKTGQPTDEKAPISWEQHTLQQPCYLQLTDELKLIQGRIQEGRIQFWNKL